MRGRGIGWVLSFVFFTFCLPTPPHSPTPLPPGEGDGERGEKGRGREKGGMVCSATLRHGTNGFGGRWMGDDIGLVSKYENLSRY